MEQPLVDILLATYNGERFLPQQLDSLLAQDYSGFRILARDDGSTDGTQALLEQYQERSQGRLRIVSDGTPTGGPKGNFSILMQHSEAPFVAFADQDDFWYSNKLRITLQRAQALQSRNGTDCPILVFTNLALADAALEPTGRSFWDDQTIHPASCRSLGRLLRQNVVTGCTMMANRRLIELGRTMPEDAYMHDWWLALLACSFGKIDYVDEPTMLYRLHAANSCGVQELPHGLPNFEAHASRAREWQLMVRQARALREAYRDQLPRPKRRLVDALVRTSDQHPWRALYTVLRYRVLHAELRRNLALLWHLAAEARPQQAA